MFKHLLFIHTDDYITDDCQYDYESDDQLGPSQDDGDDDFIPLWL